MSSRRHRSASPPVTTTALGLLAALATALLLVAAPAGAVTATDPPTEVVGGQAAAAREFPFMVGIMDRSVRNNFNAQFCGGSLIGADAVLTAAHCVEGESPATIDVLVKTSRLDGSGVRKGVRSISVHPGYDDFTSANDVAVLRLRRPVGRLGAGRAAVVPLGASSQAARWAPGTPATVTGWGLTSDGGNASVALRKVSVPVVSDTACRNAYGSELVASVMLCAGQAGRDSCQGDSGGPLVVRNGSQWLQIGVVSWGYGCGEAGYPGVYSEVPALRSWILARAR